MKIIPAAMKLVLARPKAGMSLAAVPEAAEDPPLAEVTSEKV